MPQRKRRRGDITAQPHNALIGFVLTQLKHAASLLKAALPAEVANLVRWGTLKLESIEYVDRTLRGRRADLFYSAEMEDNGRMYFEVLLEHQSTVDPTMVFRMGSTMWRRWERMLREDPPRWPLPLIVPILIHHSSTGWTAATAFQEVVAVPALARDAARRFVPRFEMKLVDVSHDPAGGLVDAALTGLCRIVLWCLSVAGDDERFEREIGRLTDELNELFASPDEVGAIIALVRYLVATHPKRSMRGIVKLVETTAMRGQREFELDPLYELKREGIEEGLEQGNQEGRAHMLLDQLAARFGRVPADVKARVFAATEPMLKRWSLRVLKAPTLEAVFGAVRSHLRARSKSGPTVQVGTARKAPARPEAKGRRAAARKRARPAR